MFSPLMQFLRLCILLIFLVISNTVSAFCLHLGQRINCPPGVPDGSNSAFFDANGNVVFPGIGGALITVPPSSLITFVPEVPAPPPVVVPPAVPPVVGNPPTNTGQVPPDTARGIMGLTTSPGQLVSSPQSPPANPILINGEVRKAVVELDACTVSGTEGIADAGGRPPNYEHKQFSGVCGPDVTYHVVNTLQTVKADFNNLDLSKQVGQCLGMGFWTIDNLRDRWSRINPPTCASPKGSACDNTVMIYGKCFQAGVANYLIYGLIEKLCGATITGSVLHALYWLGKEVTGNTTLAHLGDEWEMVSAGRAAYDNDLESAIKAMNGKPCTACSSPARSARWSYTWFPEYADKNTSYYYYNLK